jgi:hypothetical protein
MSASKGYLVTKTVRTGKAQKISLPAAVDVNLLDAVDLKIIWDKEMGTIAKRRSKLMDLLKKGYAMVYDQCLQEVKDKLEATDNWVRIQREQLLDELIMKIVRICVGFNDHKQEVFNLVQFLKTLFMYTQTDRETVEEYGQNFRSFWDTVEAFGVSPGVHKGLVAGILKEPGPVSGSSATPTKIKNLEEEASESVKAVLLISGADKRRYGQLKDELANNYLLGTDQYPDTFDKAMRILGNYQVLKPSGSTGRPGADASRVGFIQQGSRGSQGGQCGGRSREAG